MIDARTILQRFDEERKAATAPDVRVERVGTVVVHHAEPLHCVVWNGVDPSGIDAPIKRILDQHRQWGGSLEWKWFSHDPDADVLMQALSRQGFLPGEAETVMVCAVNQLPDMPLGKVRRLTNAGQLPDFKVTAEAVFGKNYMLTTTQLQEELRHGGDQHLAFIAYLGSESVGIARLYLNAVSQFGYLAGGGVRREHRGRGHYRNLVFARAAVARQRGVPYLMVDALPTSRPILERMGFTALCTTRPYTME